jgi:hypothetical protein
MKESSMVLIEVVLAILVGIAIGISIFYYFFPPRRGWSNSATLCKEAATGSATIATRLSEIIEKRQTDPATAREWCALVNQDIRTWNASFVPDCSPSAIPLVNCQSL